MNSFKEAESQAEIEATANDLRDEIGQEIKYLREVNTLRLDETEHIVTHGNIAAIGDAPPSDVARHLASMMAKSTSEPYKLKLHSCELVLDTRRRRRRCKKPCERPTV